MVSPFRLAVEQIIQKNELRINMKEQENHEMDAVAEGIKQTFFNRMDGYAVQTLAGQYYYIEKPVTTALVTKHLKGEISLGVYILNAQNMAQYAVIDADDETGYEKLLEVHGSLPIPSYLETSRRGGHLWFFFSEKVTGKVAKNFGLEIAKRHLIEAEVFPKQAESTGPGSCIRMPFGIHQKSGTRYPFMGLGGWSDQLQALTHPERISVEVVLSYQYQEPKKKYHKREVTGDFPLWEKVKQQITVMELVEQYVDLKHGMGKCPFHDDRNPSFSVNEKENYWNCFAGCGGGSVIDFWMKLNGLEFKDAVRDLAERIGVK